MAECLFCKIASGEIPTKIIFDSEDVMAFLDIKPGNPGHVLVMPKKHYMILPQLPEELNAKLLQLIKVIVQAQIDALECQGVNVLQNNGALAGQMIPHIFFHVIPRFKDDKVALSYSQLVELKEEQFGEIQKRLIESAKAIAAGATEVAPKPQQAETKAPAKEEPKKKGKALRLKPRHA